MINNVFQLVSPRTFNVKFEDLSLENNVIVRPDYLAICHADQRYYLGQRDHAVLSQKLPMAPIHEATATVVHDATGHFTAGQRVVLIPNIAGDTTSGGYENYSEGAKFRSSGYDGFLSELVSLPSDRVVLCEGIDPEVAAITEFVSVAAHASGRFDYTAHNKRDHLVIIGDGSMAYVVANVIKELFPASQVTVLGHNAEKLSLFSFVDETYYSDALPAGFTFDHAFECTGNEHSSEALDTLIDHINPEGNIILLGVNEQPVSINARMVLEKGLTLIGCSRSGRTDFEQAVSLIQNPVIQQRLHQIICLDDPVQTIADIKRVFANDLSTPFKTVFKWAP